MAVEGVEAKKAEQKTQPPKGGAVPAPAAAPVRAPGWLMPAYLGGLVLLYLSERVVVTEDKLRFGLSAIAVGLILLATVLRFIPKFRSGGERASIERLMGLLSLGGLLGVLVYFASTSAGLDLLGITGLEAKTRDRVETLLLIGWVALIAVSAVPMCFAEVALHPMRSSVHLEARRVKAAAASGFALALAVTYCSLFVYAAGQTKAQADYSYFKTSEPGSSTRKMIESFDDTLKITAFFPDVSEVRSEVAGYLTELTKGVPNVELSVVDRYLEPKLAKDMKVFSDGTVVFAKGETTRTLTVGSDMQAARAKLKTLDRDVQEQLYKLLRSRRVAYLTVGHGELNAASEEDKAKGRAAEILQEVLKSQNYQVRTLGLAQGLGREVPDDAEIVFVLGPTQGFAPEELASLQRFTQRGGHLFMALDIDSAADDSALPTAQTEPAAVQAGAAATPGVSAAGSAPAVAEQGLQDLAKLAGLSYSPALLANDSHHVRRRANNSDRALLISNRFSSHASVSTLSRNAARAAIIFARTGSLTALGAPSFKIDMALRAMGGTFADNNQNYDFDKDSEKKDTYNLVAAVTQPAVAAESTPVPEPKPGEAAPAPKEMRAFVLADADSMSDLLMSNFGPNRLLLMDAIRWLGGEDSFAGEVNDEEDVRVEHSKQKDLVWFYSTIVGMPLLVLAAGLSFSRRARRTAKAVS
jgi:gliding motility-associatede transport system auxiliary component